MFQQPDGSYNGWSFSKNIWVEDPYKNKPKDYKPIRVKKSPEQIKKELEDIGEYPVVDLPERKLRAESLDYFGIKIGLSEEDGVTPTHHYYPYYKNGELQAYKVRLIGPKHMWSIGNQKESELFGWKQAFETNAKKFIVTEGELDAVAFYQIAKDKARGTENEKYNPAVVSLSNGAGGAARELARHLPEIRKNFQEIILAFDMDDAGRKAVDDVLKIIPDAKVAILPGKDINDCLVKGKGIACFNAVMFKSATPKNTRLVISSSLHEIGKKAPEYGVTWPWKGVTELTRGIRLGETIYIGAGQKMGKSEIVNTLAAHLIKEYDWKVFMCKPEESNSKTYKLVAGKMVGKVFHDPRVPFDEEAYDAAGEMIGDNMILLNLYQHVGWETLEADIRDAALNGCRAIIIDPITNLTNGMDAATANTKLQEIAQKLSAMALDLNVVIFIFCHLRNPDNGLPHERGGEVLSSQFAGSRAMARSCNYMFGLEGNKDPNLSEEERNLRTLVLLEDREFGEVGRFKLYWDKRTQLFNEVG